MSIPDEVKLKGLAGEDGGRLSLLGPGPTVQVTLDAWRATRRLQELEFELARALTRRHAGRTTCEVPAHALFPQMLAAVRQFVRDRVELMGNTDLRDVFLDPYFSWALETLNEAVVPDEADSVEIPRFEALRGAGSTGDVDFWTSRPVRESERSHLNWVVMDTHQWEQTTAFYLDSDPHVVAFVKNFNLGFALPYGVRGEAHEYLPDFLARLTLRDGEVGTLILETKGYDTLAEVKQAGAQRWVAAVNAEGSHGRWAYRLIRNPGEAPAAVRSAAEELRAP
jgi:type III restriction enzyme